MQSVNLLPVSFFSLHEIDDLLLKTKVSSKFTAIEPLFSEYSPAGSQNILYCSRKEIQTVLKLRLFWLENFYYVFNMHECF